MNWRKGSGPFYEQNNQRITVTGNITIKGHPDHNRAVTNVIDGVFVKKGVNYTESNVFFAITLNDMIHIGAACAAKVKKEEYNHW